jgi:hypothetical protein
MSVDININSQVVEVTTNGDIYNINIAESPVLVDVIDNIVQVSASYGFVQGASTWGSITGTLSNQTDLQNALNAKVDDATTITINGTSQNLSANRTWNVGDMLKSVYDTDNNGIVDKAEKMTTICRNSTGSTMYRGTIVYLHGSTGNRPNILKAIATSDATSAQTFGVVISDIANNSDGEVATLGTLDDLDTRSNATHPFTTDTLADGDILYLSPTTAGYVTNVKPYAPYHIVYVGMVVKTHPSLGTIVYRVQNGYELDEIHNVSAQTPSNNDGLFYESSTSLWKNKSIGTILGYTPVPNTRTLTINGTAYDLSADRSWTISGLPSQTGNSGKYLTTDGTTASWATVSSGNIYNTDGTLTGNRVLSTGAYKLAIQWNSTFTQYNTTPTTNIFQVKDSANNNAFSVWSNGSVGIGVNASSAAFQNGFGLYVDPGFNAGIYTGALYANTTIRANAGGLILGNAGSNSLTFVGSNNSTSTLSFDTTNGYVMSAGMYTTIRYNTTIQTYDGYGLKLFGSTGNIVIGGTTFTDAGYKLDVQGTGRFTGGVLIQGLLELSRAGEALNLSGNSYMSINGAGLYFMGVTGALFGTNGFNGQTVGFRTTGGFTFGIGTSTYHYLTTGNATFTDITGTASSTNTIASAVLEARSTTKGFLPPRMTTAQMYAISSPANGLEVYKTDGYQGKYVYIENEWMPVEDGTEMIVSRGSQGSNSVQQPFTSNVSGTGAAVNNNVWAQTGANLLKVIPYSFATGTTSTGFAGITAATNNGLNISTVGAKFCWRYEMSTPTVLSDATNTYVLALGVSISGATITANNIGFYYSHGTNAGAWTCFWGALAGASATSGVTVAVSARYILEIEFTIGTDIKYYINGVLVLTQTTGIPTQFGTNTAIATSYLLKTAGATSIISYQGSIFFKRLK